MLSVAPVRHQAVVVTAFEEPLQLVEVAVPKLPLEYHVVVKNMAIGVNPVDWKLKKYHFAIYSFPWINGRESCGIIVQAGSKLILPQNLLVVVLSTSYRDITTLTFQEYTVVDSRLLWKLPHLLSVNQGALIGVGLTTAGVILYDSFKFGYDEDLLGKTLVIYGGSTVVGLYLAQLAKVHNIRVVAVALQQHKDYLHLLGVDEIIDRHGDVAAELELLDVDFAVDCVLKESFQTLLKHSNADKVLGIVGSVDDERAVPVVIKKFHEDLEFSRQFIGHTQNLLDIGMVQPVRTKVFRGGLADINSALSDLATNGANAEKYVVSV